jgi:hypothetical protein
MIAADGDGPIGRGRGGSFAVRHFDDLHAALFRHVARGRRDDCAASHAQFAADGDILRGYDGSHLFSILHCCISGLARMMAPANILESRHQL